MYDLRDFGNMLADGLRLDAYARAMAQSVRPGSVVVDIGTGTGVFALIAARLGARRVYAIEPNDAIEVARLLARDNGLADRIEFRQALSTRVDLPERADVIVSDLHGVLPMHRDHLPAIIDARRRFLAPGGTLLPATDTLWMAPVESERDYEPVTRPWGGEVAGLNMRRVGALMANRWWRSLDDDARLLGPAVIAATIDYSTIATPDVELNGSMRIDHDGLCHGFQLWFESEIVSGIGCSNAPGRTSLVYGRAFFPLHAPVRLHAGDRVDMTAHARHANGDYLWVWRTAIRGRSAANFRQSTFEGETLSGDALRRQAPSHVPALGIEGRADARALELMQQERSLAEIANVLRVEFASLFAGEDAALAHVAALSSRYGE